jgi:uncharacterized protein
LKRGSERNFLQEVPPRFRCPSCGGMDSKIIIFTRYPEPGKTKTRLISALGPDGAATLYRRMAEHTVGVARELAQIRGVSLEVRYHGATKDLMSSWLGDDLDYREQTGHDLGARMSRAFEDAFDDGFTRVIIVGCDCPGISIGILDTALERLTEWDLVLGPANDGGYYLIGLREPHSELFRNVAWGTDRVLDQTVGIAHYLQLSVIFVSALDDVDRPQDLLKLESKKWVS